jgi:endonuclease III
MKKATIKEIKFIRDYFLEQYSGMVTELEYTNDYELLIAIILSAQCTDKRVNIITPALCLQNIQIQKALANANLNEVKELLKSVVFLTTKRKISSKWRYL